ncbi:DUF6520 family protein [Chitinophaga sp.]|uniref:DUF6520 family protein n=1 Tax=Chitinophaga sp. TaxID=1869181 RepID=UPI0031DD56EF
MKSIKITMTALAVVLAVGAAFASKSGSLLPTDLYGKLQADSPCVPLCSTIEGPACNQIPFDGKVYVENVDNPCTTESLQTRFQRIQ